RDQVQMANRGKRVGWQGHVDAVALEPFMKLRGRELAGLVVDAGGDHLTDLVGRLPGGGSLFGRELGHLAQKIGQLGLTAEVADTDLLELGARARTVDGLERVALYPCDLVQCTHRFCILSASS